MVMTQGEGNFRVEKGDLIAMALKGDFDVIIQGCNCFCRQKSGLAKDMVKVFGTDTFPFEGAAWAGDRNKLGMIDFKPFNKDFSSQEFIDSYVVDKDNFDLTVVNCYTQYDFGRDKSKIYLNYSALAMCLDKINVQFRGKHIGVPFIGTGLANGSKMRVYKMLKYYLKDCKVTLVRHEEIGA